jgi:hypothetical protein
MSSGVLYIMQLGYIKLIHHGSMEMVLSNQKPIMEQVTDLAVSRSLD